jgi:hypothetical protein
MQNEQQGVEEVYVVLYETPDVGVVAGANRSLCGAKSRVAGLLRRAPTWTESHVGLHASADRIGGYSILACDLEP